MPVAAISTAGAIWLTLLAFSLMFPAIAASYAHKWGFRFWPVFFGVLFTGPIGFGIAILAVAIATRDEEPREIAAPQARGSRADLAPADGEWLAKIAPGHPEHEEVAQH
jgi:hypothetical protein